MIFGESAWVFFLFTVVMFGGTAFMTGQALASTWRPMWQAVPYAILLAAANRFLVFALFEGRLLAAANFVIEAALLVAIALVAYRATLAHRMVAQYPWLYERAGLFGWRDVAGGGPSR